MVMDLPAFNEANFHRKLAYDVLSELFSKKPDETLLAKLNTEGLLAFLGEHCQCEEIMGKLELTVKELLPGKARIKKLCDEFENIFLIPVAETYVPPIASAFMGPDMQNGFGKNLSEKLTVIYGAFGARFLNDKADTFVFHPDHIASMFNFMSFLIEKEGLYSKQGSPDLLYDFVYGEKRFFERFIQSWVDGFLGEVQSRASSDFYKQIAAFAKNYIESECRLLGSLHLEEIYGTNLGESVIL
ncbi:MAG: molecular chaperone TorD family protein [Nitrospiraceae bacterium]|nr:molecular chaperone TorD family protein [Nitrospiraceae bacterium]